MANYGSTLVYFVAFFCYYLELCSCFNPKNLNLSLHGNHWLTAGATWYGSPNGDGSEGGACGYEKAVSQGPFYSLITAVGPNLYNSGKECGACYQTGVACDYSGKTIAFHVDQGSNQNYMAVVVEFEEGDGDLSAVDLKEDSSEQWRAMQQSWGAVWKLDAGSGLQPPLSIRLTSQYSGQTLVAKNVIPQGWKPGATYRSEVNYL